MENFLRDLQAGIYASLIEMRNESKIKFKVFKFSFQGTW